MFMMIQRVAIYTQNVVLKRKRTFATNVSRLGEVGDLKAQSLNFSTNFK